MSGFLFSVLMRNAACAADADVDYVYESPYFYGNTNLPPAPSISVNCFDAERNTSTPIDNTTARCDFGVSCRCGLCTKLPGVNMNASTAQYCVIRHANASESIAAGFDCAPLDDAAESQCEQERAKAATTLTLSIIAYVGIGSLVWVVIVCCKIRYDRRRRGHEYLP